MQHNHVNINNLDILLKNKVTVYKQENIGHNNNNFKSFIASVDNNITSIKCPQYNSNILFFIDPENIKIK